MEPRIYVDTVAFAGEGVEKWMDDAACLYMDPEAFFPFARPKDEVREACLKCDVRIKCLAFAMINEKSNTDNRHGIWGGLDPGERRKLQKQLDEIKQQQQEKEKAS